MLDTLALIEARLRNDHKALTTILDTGNSRVHASVLAEMFARALTNYTYNPLEALAQLRPPLLAAGMGPPPDDQGPPSG